MSDIVERLRSEWPEIRVAKDAADEIERLRAELTDAKHHTQARLMALRNAEVEYREEVERLTWERDEARAGNYAANEHDPTWAQLSNYWKGHAEAAERKVEKLRESLSRMLLEVDFMVEHGVIPDVRGDIIYENARAALKETEND